MAYALDFWTLFRYVTREAWLVGLELFPAIGEPGVGAMLP